MMSTVYMCVIQGCVFTGATRCDSWWSPLSCSSKSSAALAIGCIRMWKSYHANPFENAALANSSALSRDLKGRSVLCRPQVPACSPAIAPDSCLSTVCVNVFVKRRVPLVTVRMYDKARRATEAGVPDVARERHGALVTHTLRIQASSPCQVLTA